MNELTHDKWRRNACTWGRWRLPNGREVTMLRKGQRVRFYADDGEQVGPEQRNVAPAICYAAVNGWVDCNAPPWLAAGLIAEVRATTRAHEARYQGSRE